MAWDSEIRSRLERVEVIVERLEAGEVSRSEAQALYEEGQETLSEVRKRIDADPGEVFEIE